MTGMRMALATMPTQMTITMGTLMTRMLFHETLSEQCDRDGDEIGDNGDNCLPF